MLNRSIEKSKKIQKSKNPSLNETFYLFFIIFFNFFISNFQFRNLEMFYLSLDFWIF